MLGGSEISTVLTVRDNHLPCVLTFDSVGSLQAATVAVPPKIATSKFPWKELIDNLMCSVLIHRQGFPHQGTFTVMRHFELSGKADAVLFYRDGVPAASTHPIVGDWIIDQVADSYVSALVIVREDGTPRLSVLTRFDKYGGLMTDTA